MADYYVSGVLFFNTFALDMMIGGRAIKAAFVVFIWCHCCFLERSSASEQCDSPQNPALHPGVLIKDRGGLNTLIKDAKSTREGIIPNDLPYDVISEEFSNVYGGSDLNRGHLINEWLDYAQNGLYLSGFIVFMAILLPGVMLALWMFWECCYEEDEEEDEDNRNLNSYCQTVAWGLGASLLLTLIALLIFVVVLLTGNAWVSGGVSDSAHAVRGIMPELAHLRDSTLSQVNRTVLSEYDSLTSQTLRDHLSPLPSAIASQIMAEYRDPASILDRNISALLLSRSESLGQARHLLADQQRLEASVQDLSPLQLSLQDIQRVCVHVASLNASEVTEGVRDECERLVDGGDSYVPTVVVDVASLGGRSPPGDQLMGELWLARIVAALEEDVEFLLPSSALESFITEVEGNLSYHVNETSRMFLRSTRETLERFAGSVTQDYSGPALSFGLNQSQERLEEYLGPRHLQNWEAFRSACTLTFFLLILLMSLCLLVAMVRGLLNILAIYRYGEDVTYVEGAHQAGTMIKKLAFMFTGVCITSAVFFGFFLCVNGVVGRACTPHNNFTAIMRWVVDNPATWLGEYPLGRALLGNSSYPLTVESFLDGCRLNRSLYNVMMLEQRYDLEESVRVDASEADDYVEDMNSLALLLGELTLLEPTTAEQLLLLDRTAHYPVEWDSYTNLTAASLFQPSFIGLHPLLNTIAAMRAAVAENPDMEVYQNLSIPLREVEGGLQEFIAQLQSLLPAIRSNASALESNLALSGWTAAHLVTMATDLASSVDISVSSISNSELTSAAVTVNSRLENYQIVTRQTLKCQTGFCHSLSTTYDSFSSAFCGGIVPGMDAYWVSLVIVMVISLLVITLALCLSSRLIDWQLEKSAQQKFRVVDAVIQQVEAGFWLLLSVGINLWLVVAVSQDGYFHTEFCEGKAGCCASCVWGFGILFLLLAVGVGGASRVYQCIIIYRIKKCDVREVRRRKVRRYWIDRKKAVEFYGQLLQLFVQDVPFLILAGTYANGSGVLTVPIFFSLVVSLVGMVAYVYYLVVERHNIQIYLSWLRAEVRLKKGTSPSSSQGGRPGPQTAPHAHYPGGRSHGSSESEQSEDDSQGTCQDDTGFVYLPSGRNRLAPGQRLSDIAEGSEEQAEGSLDHARPPHLGEPLPQDDTNTETDLSQAQQMSMVMLDRAVDSENEDLMRRRAERELLNRGGVEVAEPYYHRHGDCETSTSDSYFGGSQGSITGSDLPGYFSSLQPPDEHYESSDYREDCDAESDYSQHRYKHTHMLRRLGSLAGEMSVEV